MLKNLSPPTFSNPPISSSNPSLVSQSRPSDPRPLLYSFLQAHVSHAFLLKPLSLYLNFQLHQLYVLTSGQQSQSPAQQSRLVINITPPLFLWLSSQGLKGKDDFFLDVYISSSQILLGHFHYQNNTGESIGNFREHKDLSHCAHQTVPELHSHNQTLNSLSCLTTNALR